MLARRAALVQLAADRGGGLVRLAARPGGRSGPEQQQGTGRGRQHERDHDGPGDRPHHPRLAAGRTDRDDVVGRGA